MRKHLNEGWVESIQRGPDMCECGEAQRQRMEQSLLESLLCMSGSDETLLIHFRKEGGIAALNALAQCNRAH